MGNKPKPQFLIAATASGSGKTTFTLGLLRALRNRGYQVQSFKCGPDYIDPKYHELASGQQAINLDKFMMSKEHIKEVYDKYRIGKDICIVEGVMGLFDGAKKMEGSSAEIAQIINIPTILLINAAASAYSVAAIIYGFKNFKPDISISGVVFNRVASESHYQFLKEAAVDAGVTPLGYIPKTKTLEVPSRHLGLSIDELALIDTFPQSVSNMIEEHIDIDTLLRTTTTDNDLSYNKTPILHSNKKMKIAVAKDEAMNFIYEENINRLSQLGDVTFFSPLYDNVLPYCDLLYLPGGYPEFFLEQLSKNISIKKQIRAYIDKGGYAIAECGGMMYLTHTIIGMDGKTYPMVGVFDATATMDNMKLHLGYRSIELQSSKEVFKGHEFHYSDLIIEKSPTTIAHQYNARGSLQSTALYRYNNCIMGYTHIYWAEQNPMDLFA